MAGRLKVYNSGTAAWEYAAGNPTPVYVNASAPSGSPASGDLWYDTDDTTVDTAPQPKGPLTLTPLSRTYTPPGNLIGTNLFPWQSNSQTTLVLPLGTQYMLLTQLAGGIMEEFTLIVTASSLTAGQGVEISIYEDLVNSGPGLRTWNQAVVIGASTGNFTTTGLAVGLPTGFAWVSIINPSTNAGTVTFRSVVPEGGARHIIIQNGSGQVVYTQTSGVTAAPTDLSAYTFRSTVAAGAIAPAGANSFPILGAQAA